MASHTEAEKVFPSILKWFKNVKQRYLAKSPLDKWNFIRGFHMSLMKVVGLHFMVRGYKVTFRSLFPTMVLADYLIFAMYTLYYFREDLILSLMPFSAIGLIFPCLIQYVLLLLPSTRNRMRHLYNFAGDFIYARSDSTQKTYSICDQLATNLFSHSVKINLLILFSLYLTACVPLYNIFFNSGTSGHDSNEFIIVIIIPFIDPFTQRGFYINLTNQIFICLIGAIILPSIELITCALMNNISVSAALIDNGLTEFGEIINRKDAFSAENAWKFSNIIVQIMDFDRYVSDYVDTFYWKFLIQPILLVYAIIFSILLYILRDVSSAIGYSACCYIQLLILCDAGKNIVDANTTILDALNQFPFYLLSTQKQKMFALLLKRNQKKAELKIGPFVELNYETATKLTKMIYTYTMCLLKARG